ncbi:MAG: DUF1080 domain-containing protein [Planctomycetia bacterium]|nr:DUF1080 domain-containing protein [Planctomycetia bacterium]
MKLRVMMCFVLVLGTGLCGTLRADEEKNPWTPLFNGKDLDGWKVPNFGGEGDVVVENGELVINMGVMISGIVYEKEFPYKSNYEIEIVAKRTMGFDFIAALTFPIGDEHATFINGGWGGSVFGISCVNDLDASENDTMILITTKNDLWYNFKVRVLDEKVECYLDGKKIIEQKREDAVFRTRFEVEYSEPLGITNYCSETRIKSIRYRLIQ